MIGRRQFLTCVPTSMAAVSSAVNSGKRSADRPVLILRSGWQWENIGDVAHTPGMLQLLRQYAPKFDVILWSQGLDRDVHNMLTRAFPPLRFVTASRFDEDGGAELAAAFRQAAFLLHGSGPSIVGAKQIELWKERTGKPYGIFGVTIQLDGEPTAMLPRAIRDIVEGARFVFTRETTSLQSLKRNHVKGTLRFVPDATFSMTLLDDVKALPFLKQRGLETGRFLAVIPRLRYTPYQNFKKVTYSQAEIRHRTEVNNLRKEQDHAKLREVAITWVRETGGQVLLCPEMTYELELLHPLLYDPLPDDVKKRTVVRETYWLPDEAAACYERAAAVVSLECHSPILAAAHGTPGFYVHSREDGIKGQMYSDLGLGDWAPDVDSIRGKQLAELVLSTLNNPAKARARVRAATDLARQKQRDGVHYLRRVTGLSA
jgi:polysaccharide pyruvyl transferase WcaK-like protein